MVLTVAPNCLLALHLVCDLLWQPKQQNKFDRAKKNNTFCLKDPMLIQTNQQKAQSSKISLERLNKSFCLKDPVLIKIHSQRHKVAKILLIRLKKQNQNYNNKQFLPQSSQIHFRDTSLCEKWQIFFFFQFFSQNSNFFKYQKLQYIFIVMYTDLPVIWSLGL